jgi:hypothetical protein
MSMGTADANFARTCVELHSSKRRRFPAVKGIREPDAMLHDAVALKRDIEEARCNSSEREYDSDPTKSNNDRGGKCFLFFQNEQGK